MSIQEILHSLADGVSGSASVRRVYGDPVTAGDRTVIPVARIRYGFGGGGGGPQSEDDARQGGGGGGGVSATPCGALEVTPAGTRFIPYTDPATPGIAFALGFVLGAALMALTGGRRVEVVKARR
jgi:uncharacterized spore protein YtfJ